MNDEIQVTNRELLVACYAAIAGVFADAGIVWNGTSGSGKWSISVHASQNDLLGYDSWDFPQSREDPHMQHALVNAKRFVTGGFAEAKALKQKFDDQYARLKDEFGDEFRQFLTFADEKFDSDNYETSSWSSSSDNCW